jgi:hypothetical protein
MAQLTKLKQFAEKRLKEDSTLRSLILSEPNELRDSQAIERAKIFLKLADKELNVN